MIPKIIWQTYETPFKDLLPETKDCVDTWKEKNPTWKYMYMDSQERDDFVLHEFDQEWYELFTTCSLGIVKANIWRCMILYIYGGVYSDLDTICNESIESWINPEYELTVARDDDGNPKDFAINVIAAKPNSKSLENILNVLKLNLKNNKPTIDNVISLFGEGVWSEVLLSKEEHYNIYCYEEGSNIFKNKAVTHLGTFKDWHKNGYIQWFKRDNI